MEKIKVYMGANIRLEAKVMLKDIIHLFTMDMDLLKKHYLNTMYDLNTYHLNNYLDLCYFYVI
mgnify:CR=1 FL=1